MYIGNISPKNTDLKFTGRCFDFTLHYENRTETSFDLVVNASNKQTLLCKDYLFFGNTELRHIDWYFEGGDHRITFNLTPDRVVDFDFNVLQVF